MAKVEKEIDYDVPTSYDMQEQMRLYMEKYNKNSVVLSGKVVETRVGEPRQKFDKKTNLPILDEDGMPQYWEPFRSCEIIFEGGSLNVNLSAENYQKITIGERYCFEGIMGVQYGKTQPVFHSVTKL